MCSQSPQIVSHKLVAYLGRGADFGVEGAARRRELLWRHCFRKVSGYSPRPFAGPNPAMFASARRGRFEKEIAR
jgi:hypothetical protein